jgi:simple sugar transport system substrate-binding protein
MPEPSYPVADVLPWGPGRAELVRQLFFAVLCSAAQGRRRAKEVSVEKEKYIQTKVEELASTVEDLSESDVPRGMNRAQLLKVAGAGGAVATLPALLAACGGGGGGSEAGTGKYPKTPKWKFVFVNHVTTNPFFVPTQYGISDADQIFGTSNQWTGSENSDVSQMVSAVNTAISSGADGIAVSIIDPKAFNGPVKKALDANIPVVSYNADAPPASGNERLAYIGQDLFQSGVKMGERIATLISSGDVAGFIATPGSLNIQPRIDGAKQAIAQSGKSINFTQIATGPDVNEELSKIDAYYQGHKSLKGMFAVDAGSTQGVAQTMQKYGLQNKGIHGGGYDLLPTTLKLIDQGFLDFTIDQQPYLQGFYPVVQLFLYKLSGGLMAPSETNTGLLFVTKDNVKPYLTTKTRYEGSSSKQQYVKTS